MARSGSMQRVPQVRASWASMVITSIATGVAVLTVLVSALAVRAGNDPYAYAGRQFPAWLTVVGLTVIGFIVAGLLATRTRPGASGGLAAATIGSLLPLWATWSWLPDRVQAGVLAATPFAVMVALVALSWSASGSSNPSPAMRIVVALVVASGVVHLLGYNPFADSGCTLTCADVTPLLGGLLSTRSAVVVSCSLTIVGAVLAAIIVLKDSDRHTPRLHHRRRDSWRCACRLCQPPYGWRLGRTTQPQACCLSSRPCPWQSSASLCALLWLEPCAYAPRLTGWRLGCPDRWRHSAASKGCTSPSRARRGG